MSTSGYWASWIGVVACAAADRTPIALTTTARTAVTKTLFIGGGPSRHAHYLPLAEDLSIVQSAGHDGPVEDMGARHEPGLLQRLSRRDVPRTAAGGRNGAELVSDSLQLLHQV